MLTPSNMASSTGPILNGTEVSPQNQKLCQCKNIQGAPERTPVEDAIREA